MDKDNTEIEHSTGGLRESSADLKQQNIMQPIKHFFAPFTEQPASPYISHAAPPIGLRGRGASGQRLEKAPRSKCRVCIIEQNQRTCRGPQYQRWQAQRDNR